MIKRRHWVVLHRWTGLVLAGFLLLVGLTGSLLPFYRDIDKALSPDLLTVNVPVDIAPLDPLQLREQVLARHPELRIDRVRLAREKANDALVFYVTGRSGALAYDELYVDPYTGRELGTRRWGDLTEGRVNLMPFVYRLHYSLAADGPGRTLLGIIALLWTLDCFVGAWLTLPVRLPRRDGLLVRRGNSWWSRWLQAWRVRFDSGAYRFSFDMHRAAGLWLWAMLFVIAWSAVSFNLSEVYRPVMGALLGPWESAPLPTRHDAQPLDDQRLDWVQARAHARALMGKVSATSEFVVNKEELLSIDRSGHTWRYVVSSDRDVSERRGATKIVFDAHTGELLHSHMPTGHSAAQSATTWLQALHMARVGGLPMRVATSAIGLLVAVLCVTGVVVWFRKRAGRQHAAARHVGPRGTAPPGLPEPGNTWGTARACDGRSMG